MRDVSLNGQERHFYRWREWVFSRCIMNIIMCNYYNAKAKARFTSLLPALRPPRECTHGAYVYRITKGHLEA